MPTKKKERDPGGWNAYDRYFRAAHKDLSERTRRLLKQAGLAGNAIAFHELVLSHGKDRNPKLRNLWFDKLTAAAEGGTPLAQRELGKYYLFQKPPKLAEAREWLSRAAGNGDPGAFHVLHNQLPAYGPPRTPLERASRHESNGRHRMAVALLKYCAARGNAKAQASLWQLYANGARGVRTDRQRRRYWQSRLLASARQGNVWAQQALGFSHLFGDGVRQNLRRARYWLLCAAGNGDAEVQLNLHCWGAALRLSETEAKAWHEKAAANGDAGALWEKGCKALGADGKASPAALALIEEAARKGCPPAIEWYDRWQDREQSSSRRKSGRRNLARPGSKR